MENTKYAVVVDPTSSGSLLAGELKERGYECIAVHGRPLPDTLVKSYNADDFSHVFFLNDNYDELVENLSGFELVAIFAGNEPGVKLADRLIHDFGLVGNNFAYSEARTDKYEMQEAIRRKGLKAIRQYKSDNVDDILSWVKDYGKFPVIVKPVSSGGTDGVVQCTNLSAVAKGCAAILDRMNIFGFNNTEVLVQEFIEGTEYVINSVSCQGQHFLTEMGRYRKYIGATGAPVYQEMRYIMPETDAEKSLVEYNEAVLDALGVHVGPTHSEIMLTQDGPVLIETGARLAGVFIPRHTLTCARYSQLDLTVDAVLDPDQFFRKKAAGQHFHKFTTIYCLSSYQAGVVSALPGRVEIENLPSFAGAIWRIAEGGFLNVTSDIISSPGLIYLAHENENQLINDIKAIEALEQDNRLAVFKAAAP